jgi:hypothetical protein
MVSPSRSLAVLLLLSTLSCTTGQPQTSTSAASDDGAELAAVIGAIRQAIVEAQTHDVPGFPPLKSIAIRLQTTVSRSAGGQVRYLVFSLGSRVGVDTASTLELDMRPPASRSTEMLLPAASLKEALAKAIHLAKIGVVEASKGDPPLVMKKIDIDLKFAVQVEGSAGAGVKLLPLGIEGTGHISREKAHSVSLTFGQ